MRTPGVTIYRDIYEVRAGEQIVFGVDYRHASRYWSLQSHLHTDDLETTTERLRSLLEDTVKRQLIADVPVVAMLSGGLDSSGIVALAAREFHQQDQQLHTYSIDFVGSEKHFTSSVMQTSQDGPWARRVSEYTGTEHHVVMMDSTDLLEHLLTPVYAHDMPSLGQMETSLYLLCKAMREHATVALSGESADELFGGYAWFYSEEARRNNEFPWHILFDRRIAENTESFWWSSDLIQRIQPLAYSDRRYQEALAEVPRLEGEGPLDTRIREISFMNLTRFLPVLLSRKDRMSMANGFEVRVPYCDYRLVEYAWNIPWKMKNTGDLEKGILRRALTDVLPEDARNRKKSPYPLTLDPAYKAGLSDWLLQILNDPNAPVRPLLNLSAARKLAEGKLPGVPGALTVMPMEQIIQVNAWLRKYHIPL
jgi:asparagine synthase (glutamine-hydrolysing)